jgi:thioesterase domain-containing protein
VGVHDNFFEIGGDSLLTIQVANRASEERLAVSPTSLFELKTIAAIAQSGEARWKGESAGAEANAGGGDVDASCLVVLRAEGALDPLFLVHAATGVATEYVELIGRLGRNRPVHGIQAPALSGRGQPFETVEAMVREYVSAIRTVQPRGPYLLGGWSFGGLAAFEMARELTRMGERVKLLALIDAILPETAPEVAYDDAVLLAAFAAHHRVTVSLEILRGAEPAERLALVRDAGASTDAFGRNAHVGDVATRFRVFAANVKAAASYAPGAYSGRLTLIQAREPLTASVAELTRRDPSRGWSRYSAVPPTIHVVVGDHGGLLARPSVDVVASLVQAALDEPDPETPERAR